jgi:divinyl protochlorophyllide a 8-vinyl-reductase
MQPPRPGPLKTPGRPGYMSAAMVLPLHDVVAEVAGADQRDRLFRDAGLHRLPTPEDAIRQRVVLAVFQAIRHDLPELQREIFEIAGRRAGEHVLCYRIPSHAQKMMRRMPWPIALWMTLRGAQRKSWAYAGSAEVRILTQSMDFELVGNPTICRGSASEPICHFHQAVIQSMLQKLVHPGLRVRETSCEGAGHDACRFRLSMARDGGVADRRSMALPPALSGQS